MSFSWTYIPQVDERISSQFPAGLVTSGFPGCFSVDEVFRFRLPFPKEPLCVTIIVDGGLQEGGLLRRHHSMNELTLHHVPPLVVRPVACADVFCTPATGFPADFRAL